MLTWHLDLDRSNLGNARLQGLPEDLLDGDPTASYFDWVNSAFFFSYVRELHRYSWGLILIHTFRSSFKSPQRSRPN